MVNVPLWGPMRLPTWAMLMPARPSIGAVMLVNSRLRRACSTAASAAAVFAYFFEKSTAHRFAKNHRHDRKSVSVWIISGESRQAKRNMRLLCGTVFESYPFFWLLCLVREHWKYFTVVKSANKFAYLIDHFLVIDVSCHRDDCVRRNVLSFEIFEHLFS